MLLQLIRFLLPNINRYHIARRPGNRYGNSFYVAMANIHSAVTHACAAFVLFVIIAAVAVALMTADFGLRRRTAHNSQGQLHKLTMSFPTIALYFYTFYGSPLPLAHKVYYIPPSITTTFIISCRRFTFTRSSGLLDGHPLAVVRSSTDRSSWRRHHRQFDYCFRRAFYPVVAARWFQNHDHAQYFRQ